MHDSDDSMPALIVVNYGSSHLLERQVVQTLPDGGHARVWVVDNPTTEEERTRVRALAASHGWSVVEPPRNVGFGAGVNLAARRAVEAGARALVLLNPDVNLAPADLLRLLAVVEQHPDALVAPTVLRPDGTVYSQGHDLLWSTGRMRSAVHRTDGQNPRRAEWASAACWAMSVHTWERVGPMAEEYFLYWEDVEWCVRAQQRGVRTLVLPEVQAIHDDGGTQTHDRPRGYTKSAAYVYYSVRNRLLFARRHGGLLDQARWWATTPLAVATVLGHGGRRGLAQSLTPWRAAASGVRDGALGRTGSWRRGGALSGQDVTVVQSFPPPRPTTNPYIVMLARELAATPGVRVHTFSWREALCGSYDVVHLHWPENLTQGSTWWKSLAKCVLCALWCVRVQLSGVPVVRTRHNLFQPTGLNPVRRALLDWWERLSVREVHLNPCTTSTVPSDLVLHGHYRQWYARYPRLEAVAGRLCFVGLVRRYKGVVGLLQAWRGVAGDASLTITGQVSTKELETELRGQADQRVTMDLRYVDDATWVQRVTESVCVVLPYAHMHNSGTVLAVLSLGRPVLVPRSQATDELAVEVGDGWVMRYDGALTSAHLEHALVQGRAIVESGASPRLQAREWGGVGQAHLGVYRVALGTKVPAPAAPSLVP